MQEDFEIVVSLANKVYAYHPTIVPKVMKKHLNSHFI